MPFLRPKQALDKSSPSSTHQQSINAQELMMRIKHQHNLATTCEHHTSSTFRLCDPYTHRIAVNAKLLGKSQYSDSWSTISSARSLFSTHTCRAGHDLQGINVEDLIISMQALLDYVFVFTSVLTARKPRAGLRRKLLDEQSESDARAWLDYRSIHRRVIDRDAQPLKKRP